METAEAIIIGGGVLGASLAYEMTRRTLRVTLLEAHALSSGVTGSGFAWLNATAKTEDLPYHALNAQGLAKYETLANDLGTDTIGLRGGGMLRWTDSQVPGGFDTLRSVTARLQEWGYPVVTLNAGEIRALEPETLVQDDAVGMFAPADRWVDAPRLTRVLAEHARRLKAVIREYTPAIGFSRDRTGNIASVKTADGEIFTRILILAAGLQTPVLLAQIAGTPETAQRVPLEKRPGLLVETGPGSAAGKIQRVLYPPDNGGLHLRPTPAGGLILGADDADLALQTACEGEPPPDGPVNLLARATRSLRYLPADILQKTANARICHRPVPADDRPIVGAISELSGVYVAVTHSGLTLGPLLADLLAEQIVNGRVPQLLRAYTPDRFA